MGVFERVIGERVIGEGRDWGVILLEQVIGEQEIDEQVIYEKENLGASDWGMLEKKHTVRMKSLNIKWHIL